MEVSGSNSDRSVVLWSWLRIKFRLHASFYSVAILPQCAKGNVQQYVLACSLRYIYQFPLYINTIFFIKLNRLGEESSEDFQQHSDAKYHYITETIVLRLCHLLFCYTCIMQNGVVENQFIYTAGSFGVGSSLLVVYCTFSHRRRIINTSTFL